MKISEKMTKIGLTLCILVAKNETTIWRQSAVIDSNQKVNVCQLPLNLPCLT
jgi:hypothetical protein